MNRSSHDVRAEPAHGDPIEETVQEAVDHVLDGAGSGGPEPIRARVPAEVDEQDTPPWAERLVRFLDDGLRVPGTDFRFGADGIIGFFLPMAGDMATGVGSVALLLLALKERVPTVVIGRMVLNIALDTLVGAFPFIGDVFDVFWKSNRRNLDLIEQYRDDPDAKPSFADYLLVGGGLILAITSMFLPMVVLWLLAGFGFVAFDWLGH